MTYYKERWIIFFEMVEADFYGNFDINKYDARVSEFE